MEPTKHLPTRILTISIEGVDVGHVEIQSMMVTADIEDKGETNPIYELYGHSRPMVYVKFFYVLPQFRSYGIGQRVLEEIFKMSKSKGVDLVVLFVVPENDKGLKFYKRVGLTDTGRTNEPGWLLFQYLIE